MQQQPFFNLSTLVVIALGLLSSVVILLQTGFELLLASSAAFILCASAVVAGIVHQQQNALHKKIAKYENLLAKQKEIMRLNFSKGAWLPKLSA